MRFDNLALDGAVEGTHACFDSAEVHHDIAQLDVHVEASEEPAKRLASCNGGAYTKAHVGRQRGQTRYIQVPMYGPWSAIRLCAKGRRQQQTVVMGEVSEQKQSGKYM